jgi:hypothetical protein
MEKSCASREKRWLERKRGARKQPRETMEKNTLMPRRHRTYGERRPAAEMVQSQIAGVTKRAGHCRVLTGCGGGTAWMKLDEDARCCSRIAGGTLHIMP